MSRLNQLIEDVLAEDNKAQEWAGQGNEDIQIGTLGRTRDENGNWVSIVHSWSPFD